MVKGIVKFEFYCKCENDTDVAKVLAAAVATGQTVDELGVEGYLTARGNNPELSEYVRRLSRTLDLPLEQDEAVLKSLGQLDAASRIPPRALD